MMSIWTPAQRDYIIKHYHFISRDKMLTMVNNHFGTAFKLGQLQTFLKNNKIRSGLTGHFSPEHGPSWNKGTKGLMKPNKTSFKPGHKPANIKPIGSTRLDKDGYLKIKVAEPSPWNQQATHYKSMAVHLYEQHYGTVPADHLIIFKDSNPLNCTIENLEAVHQHEHLIRNQLQINQQPEPVKPLLRTLAKLKHSIYKTESAA